MEQGAELTSAATPQPRASPRSAAAAVRSWADVPDNILVRVSAFLRCRADRVHMACVNRQWSFAVRGIGRPPPPVLSPLPPQLPWLIFPNTETPTFYSPITRRHHRLRWLPPVVRRARFCGSGDGCWLVLALDAPHAHALYNLNSGQRIPLPRGTVTPMSTELPFDMRAAALSSAPYMVAAIVVVAVGSTVAFWSEGSDSWFSPGDLLAVPLGLQDLVCYEGIFYFVTTGENVFEFSPEYGPNGDATLHRRNYNIQRRGDYDFEVDLLLGNSTMKRYLVGSRESLLLVVRYVDTNDNGREATELIRVFELREPPMTNCIRPRPVWEDLHGQLDGRMLFLGSGCSRSFEVADYDGFEESMIYFLDERMAYVPSPDGRSWFIFTDMGRYSMVAMNKEPWPSVHPQVSNNAPPTWWLH